MQQRRNQGHSREEKKEPGGLESDEPPSLGDTENSPETPNPIDTRESRVHASLLLGWEQSRSSSSLGFHVGNGTPDPVSPTKELLSHHQDSHYLTIAPTGSGKGRSVIIPNLLSWPGSVVVIDPKGENYQVTARYRRKKGHQVVALDPFHVMEKESQSFNPFDLLELPGADLDSDSYMLAWQMAAETQFARDPFWDIQGTSLVYALISHLAATADPKDRHMGKVVELLYQDDLVYSIATMLDTGVVKHPHAYRELAAFLNLPERDTRPSVLATARSYVKAFHADNVYNSLKDSSFSLQEFVDGRPISIYLIIPPEKLHSHRSLLRVWLGGLLTAVCQRKRIPDLRTLFLIDEAAQLGTMPLLEKAITLLRGYGLTTWTFWQDLSQLRTLYPAGWETLLNNCGVLQTFGIANGLMADSWSEVLGLSMQELLELPSDQSLVQIQGEGNKRVQKLDYLRDPMFAGRFDPNRRYDPPSKS